MKKSARNPRISIVPIFVVTYVKVCRLKRDIFRLLSVTRIASSSAMLELIPGELVLVTGGTGLYGSAIRNVEDINPKTVVICAVSMAALFERLKP